MYQSKWKQGLSPTRTVGTESEAAMLSPGSLFQIPKQSLAVTRSDSHLWWEKVLPQNIYHNL